MNFLNSLPQITFVDTDPARVQAAVLEAYEAAAGKTLYPGDPVRLFLESVAYVLAHQRYLIEYSARQNLLAYAEGGYLDHLGALVDTARLPAAAAGCTLRFGLSVPLPHAVAIPAGSRVSAGAGDGVIFGTAAYAEIPAGALHVDVRALCLQPGAAGNGYVTGQLNRLVDPLPYVTSVRNLEVSLGGADIEGDANFRERVHLAPEKFSVGGPRGAYYYWARSAHPDIADVAVYSPAPGRVHVAPLLADGRLPDAAVLAAVDALINDERIRPLTDMVEVHAPTMVPYDLNVTWWLNRDDATLAAQVQAAVERAVEEFVTWQQSRLGRDLTPSRLIQLIMAAGAKRVVVAAPEYRVLEPWEVAVPGQVDTYFGGSEER